MNKKQIQRLTAIAVEAIRGANDEFERATEAEALTFYGLQLRRAQTGLVARAANVDEDTAKAAIERATKVVDDALAAKKAAKLDESDDE